VPGNLSGRIVVATFWTFGFIILCFYTANLAAVFTVPRLEHQIDSLNDLVMQHKVQYAPVVNTTSWLYFKHMNNVEGELHK